MSRILSFQEAIKGPYPKLIMVDNRSGNFLSSRIKAHTGNYNHIACIVSPTTVASQDPQGYRFRPIETYFQPDYFIKIWIVDMTDEEQQSWNALITAELNKPMMYAGYDYLGIIGQYLHSVFHWKWLRKINNPLKKFCSEREATHLNAVFDFGLPVQISPSEANQQFHNIPRMKVEGYWFDEES